MNRRPLRRAVTLLEIVLSVGLLVVLSSLTYWFYSSSLETRAASLNEANRIQLARVVLDRMATEIRQVVSATRFRNVSLRGEPERLWLVTEVVPGIDDARERMLTLAEEPIREFDLVKIEYKIARHPEILHDEGWELPLGLARVDIRVPRKDSAETGAAFTGPGAERPDVQRFGPEDGAGGGSGASGTEEPADVTDPLDPTDPMAAEAVDVTEDIHFDELYAPEIRYLRFCYYDGKSWWDRWDVNGENPLPQLIQVTIGFRPRPPFGGEFALEQEVEEYCTCMNEKDVELQECVELDPDLYTMVVRLPMADVFFRSRIARESQALVEEMGF